MIKDGPRSMKKICTDPDMPCLATIMNWQNDYPEFLDQLDRAKAMRAELQAEELIDICDDEEDVQRAKLKVETRKWIASKLIPKKFGDKITQEVVGKDGGPVQVVQVYLPDNGRDARD